MLIDITYPLNDNTPVYNGDPVFKKELIFNINDNHFNLNKISMGTHTGTHLDTPYHFLEDKKGIEFPVELFITNSFLLDVSDINIVDTDFLKSIELENFSSLIFKTSGKDISVSPDAAEYIASLKTIKIIGTDNMDIENVPSHPAHKTLLSSDIFILENLFLENIEPGKYTLYTFPLKIENSDGYPVRAALEK